MTLHQAECIVRVLQGNAMPGDFMAIRLGLRNGSLDRKDLRLLGEKEHARLAKSHFDALTILSDGIGALLDVVKEVAIENTSPDA